MTGVVITNMSERPVRVGAAVARRTHCPSGRGTPCVRRAKANPADLFTQAGKMVAHALSEKHMLRCDAGGGGTAGSVASRDGTGHRQYAPHLRGEVGGYRGKCRGIHLLQGEPVPLRMADQGPGDLVSMAERHVPFQEPLRDIRGK